MVGLAHRTGEVRDEIDMNHGKNVGECQSVYGDLGLEREIGGYLDTPLLTLVAAIA